MPTARRLTTTSIAALCLLTGCQPATTPTTTPTPTYTCTPEAGGPEYTCTPFQHDDMLAKDKLYTEAEAVYRKFFAENTRILRKGGVSEPTTVLLETTSGAFLEDAMSKYRSFVDKKMTIRGGDPTVARFSREPGKSKQGSIVAASVCVDGSQLRFYERGKDVGRGTSAVDLAYFARIDGLLRIIGADGKQVDSCG